MMAKPILCVPGRFGIGIDGSDLAQAMMRALWRRRERNRAYYEALLPPRAETRARQARTRRETGSPLDPLANLEGTGIVERRRAEPGKRFRSS